MENLKTTPLPVKTMFILCLVILCEPVSYSLLFPFVYFMVKDFNISEEASIGYYVGFITASFAFAQFCSAFFWGWLSDRIGRRPVLLLGLVGNSVSTVFFGMSKSFLWCIIARSSCGLLSGNIGVAKSVLGEITDSTNRGAAFALIALNYCIGTLIGPMLGGLLTDPVHNISWLFGNSVFFRQYPYILPCLCSAFISGIGFLVGWLYLPETCPRKVAYFEDEDETQTLLWGAESIDESSIYSRDSFDNQSSNSENRNPIEPLLSKIRSKSISVDEESISSDMKDFSLLGGQVFASSLAYALMAFHSVIFSETFPLFAVDKPGIGLGFSTREIGISLSSAAIFALASQLLVYPYLSRKFSLVTLYRVPIFFVIPLIWMFPLMASYLVDSIFLWPILIGVFASLEILKSIIFTSVMIMISNSAKPSKLGIVNGIAQSYASLTRTIGPALGGALWSWSYKNGLLFPLDHSFIFAFLTLLLLVCLAQSLMLK